MARARGGREVSPWRQRSLTKLSHASVRPFRFRRCVAFKRRRASSSLPA
jgi:hypothetical protein